VEEEHANDMHDLLVAHEGRRCSRLAAPATAGESLAGRIVEASSNNSSTCCLSAARGILRPLGCFSKYDLHTSRPE